MPKQLKAVRFVIYIWLSIISLPYLVVARQAGDSLKYRKPVLLVGFGAHAIKGSLESRYEKYLPSLQVGLRLEKRKSRALSFHLSAGSLISDKYNYQQPIDRFPGVIPATYVRTNYFTINIDQHIYLLRFRAFTLGASLGFGFIRFNTFNQQGRQLRDVFVSRAPGETFAPTAVILPFHIMAQYKFANDLGVGIQAGWLNTRTKGLDNMNLLATEQRNDNIGGFRFFITMPLKAQQ
jgi:hypothetical protein